MLPEESATWPDTAPLSFCANTLGPINAVKITNQMVLGRIDFIQISFGLRSSDLKVRAARLETRTPFGASTVGWECEWMLHPVYDQPRPICLFLNPNGVWIHIFRTAAWVHYTPPCLRLREWRLTAG